MVRYHERNVLEAAQERIAKVFDNFERVFVSASAGKDSTVLFHLCVEEAQKRNRKINLLFLDQEAEYQGTIETIRRMMTHPTVIPWWFQVPIYMTNATSYSQPFLYAWGEGEEWMRPKDPLSIHSIDEPYPKRFYPFFKWLESKQDEPTAFMVGLRSKESMNRFRAATQNPGYKDWAWSTKTNSLLSFRFYPIYDWTFGDVWKCIADRNIPYNPVYDRLYCLRGKKLNDIRVSNLIHEKSLQSLAELQEIEPDTYERICKRLKGTDTAARYAREKFVYQAVELPKGFSSWREYRDYLLESAPMVPEYRDKMRRRFARQPDVAEVHRQQCRQVLLCDHENNVPVNTRGKSKRQLVEEWWDVL